MTGTSGKTPMPHAQASEAAAAILRIVEPHCERAELAGSLRRQRRWIGDIEIVVIPVADADLFGEPADRPLFDQIDSEVRAGRWHVIQGHSPHAKASRYRAFGVQLDLFLVTPETWGVHLALRTGPADFSRRLVTERYRGGLLQDGYQVQGGRLLLHAERPVPIPTPEEADFMAYAGGWVEPHLRL